MTRDVVTVGPDTPVASAAEVMAERGFAAVPVVDGHDGLLGIVAEADVLRDRLPRDPRLHMIREPARHTAPALLVRGVMTTGVRTVAPTADLADVARLFVDGGLRSVPVVDGEHLVGIVSRRDLLRTLVRPDTDVRQDVLRLVEGYTQELGGWAVDVTEGVATVRRSRDTGDPTGERLAVDRAVETLASTVPGVLAVRLLADRPSATSATGTDHPTGGPA
ncbi:CBS domain-containing protein [Modestobacter sp. SSW1-42]|uniref:CBS domain-containing protein n=1 Tax=Modestobacter sp. SSW1-42 TaxID=596372 RepID=UPI003987EAF3